jgi:hypothetical protein
MAAALGHFCSNFISRGLYPFVYEIKTPDKIGLTVVNFPFYEHLKKVLFPSGVLYRTHLRYEGLDNIE